jgi:hypothetical protein
VGFFQNYDGLFGLTLDVCDKHEYIKNELSRLRRKRRGTRTEEEMALFLTLPASIVELELAVEEVREELGTPEFTQLRAATGG